MNAKKWTAMLCAAALAVSLTACGTQTAETADAGTALTGQVSAVDGSEVTLLLGTLEEGEAGTAPDGAPGQDGQTGTPPEKHGAAPTAAILPAILPAIPTASPRKTGW